MQTIVHENNQSIKKLLFECIYIFQTINIVIWGLFSFVKKWFGTMISEHNSDFSIISFLVN